jgi:hypothetical protein
MLLNSVNKLSKSSRREEIFFNNGANHDNAAPYNKISMRLTWDAQVFYCQGYNRNISQIWLTKARNSDRVPSKGRNDLKKAWYVCSPWFQTMVFMSFVFDLHTNWTCKVIGVMEQESDSDP